MRRRGSASRRRHTFMSIQLGFGLTERVSKVSSGLDFDSRWHETEGVDVLFSRPANLCVSPVETAAQIVWIDPGQLADHLC